MINFLRVMHLNGSNIWTYRPVIEAWVDIGQFEDLPSNQLPGFNERLIQWLPSLIEHQCGLGYRGGFLERLHNGTWIGHIMEHVVLELQSLAGMQVNFGQTRSTVRRGVYRLVFQTRHERVGRAALDSAREIVLAAIHDHPLDIDSHFNQLRALINQYYFDNATIYLDGIADRYDIPLVRLNTRPEVQLGYGKNQKRLMIDNITYEDNEMVRDYYDQHGHGRIPIVSVIDSETSSLITQAMAWLLYQEHYDVGLGCQEGLFINDACIDSNGQDWAAGHRLLTHPDVNAIVFETSKKMILSEGIFYDLCDVSIITDAQGYDKLQDYFIEEPDQLYHVLLTQLDVMKKKKGYAVLNAAEPLLVELAERCCCKIIFYALDPHTERMVEHRHAGQRSVFVRQGLVVLAEGSHETVLFELEVLPVLLQQQPENVLAIVSAAWAFNISYEKMIQSLMSFRLITCRS